MEVGDNNRGGSLKWCTGRAREFLRRTTSADEHAVRCSDIHLICAGLLTLEKQRDANDSRPFAVKAHVALWKLD